ncbi:hypothetical protein CU097_012085 [Rhizopus azygosporus]|uniref:PIN domain-like protein n=1 Tax=Rhizopus azygosporus TaxID=86630 RepID=A0A367JLD1_RHIAZ|nr:hypothetical protein CU097_012085 [Rhizopus azygosporus]
MGVNGLTGILRRFAPNSIRQVSPSLFAKQTIAVDASCHLNKFVYGDEPHPYKHIYGFYLLSRFFDMNNINPIFVFDGSKRLEAKRLEHEKRERQRSKVKHTLLFEQEQAARLDAWLEITEDMVRRIPNDQASFILTELGDSLSEMDHAVSGHDVSPEVERAIIANKLSHVAQDLREAVIQVQDTEKYTRTARELASREKNLVTEMLINRLRDVKSSLESLSDDNQINRQSLEKRSVRITQALRKECQEFLECLGYICFSCDNHEAEAMCAHLGKAKRTTATISEDLDTLAFGDTPLLRYFFSRTQFVLYIDPVIAREELNLSRDSFLDFCILCGTDFSGTIQGIGPIRALQYIQKYKSIENILGKLDEINPKYTPQKSFDYKLARRVFNSLPPIPENDLVYERPSTNQSEIEDLLRYYEIDTVEADVKVKTAVVRQNITQPNERGTDPFSVNTFDSTLLAIDNNSFGIN